MTEVSRTAKEYNIHDALSDADRLDSLSRTVSLSFSAAEQGKALLAERVGELNDAVRDKLGLLFSLGANEIFVERSDAIIDQQRPSDFTTCISVVGYFAGFTIFDRAVLSKTARQHEQANERLMICLVIDPNPSIDNSEPSVKHRTFVPVNKVDGPVREIS